MVAVFRANGLLLHAGDRLVAPLGLTSARWQVLGALALAGAPLTTPAVAGAMGVSRQGAQKQLGLLLDQGLVMQGDNPRHERSPLYALTTRGRRLYESAMRLHRDWAADLGKGLSLQEIDAAAATLEALSSRLALSMSTDELS